MSTNIRIHKAIYGSLLLGASVLSGDAMLMATAGAIGVNWTSDGLGSLWQQAHSALSPASPVTRAATRAIQRAVDELRDAYLHQHGPRAMEAFELVRTCAAAVVEAAQRTSDPMMPMRPEETLPAALDELLHGHDPGAVGFIKGNLLGAVARAFREELSKDTEAWNSFHGMLLEKLEQQVGTLKGTLEGFSEVVLRFAQSPKALDALQGATERLEALIAQLQQAQGAAMGSQATVSFRNLNLDANKLEQAGGSVVEGQGTVPSMNRTTNSSVTFDNSNVRAGSVTQAGEHIYKGSTVVQPDKNSEPEKS